MRHPPPARDPEAAFAELYTTVYPDLVGFVRRRGHDHDAEDVAAEALTDAGGQPADPRSPRARAALERILTDDAGPVARAPRRRSPERVRRTALAGGAVAAVAAVAAMLPAIGGGDRAFATWTSEPSAMSAADSRAATDSCPASQLDGADGAHTAQLEGARPVLTERRGAWLTMVLAGPDGFSALCITDDSTRFFTEDTVGSVGTADVPTPGPTDVVATDLGTTTMDAGHLSLAVGVVGDQVAGVTYRSLEHGEVTATVTDGHFAFWARGRAARPDRRTRGGAAP